MTPSVAPVYNGGGGGVSFTAYTAAACAALFLAEAERPPAYEEPGTGTLSSS